MSSLLRWLGALLPGRRPPPAPRPAPAPSGAAAPRAARRAALLLMYSGSGYHGMQRQPGGAGCRPTIEGALLDCLLAAGRISPAQWASPAAALDFGCASRTDSGVSALAQVVTLRLDLPDPDALTLDLNRRLPDGIRVLQAVRVTGGFSGRRRVRHRTYAYLCPTFALSPDPLPSPFAYRVEPERLGRLRSCLARYSGTRNYCNFTPGRQPEDPACMRHVLNCWAEAPLLYGGLEFVEVRVTGQSFMRHQIRRMVGLCIAVVSGHLDASAMDAAFAPGRTPVPQAPGLGLLLRSLNYETYNRCHAVRLGYPTLDWARFAAERAAFEAAHLLPAVHSGETEGRSMLDWLRRLRLRQSGL